MSRQPACVTSRSLSQSNTWHEPSLLVLTQPDRPVTTCRCFTCAEESVLPPSCRRPGIAIGPCVMTCRGAWIAGRRPELHATWATQANRVGGERMEALQDRAFPPPCTLPACLALSPLVHTAQAACCGRMPPCAALCGPQPVSGPQAPASQTCGEHLLIVVVSKGANLWPASCAA